MHLRPKPWARPELLSSGFFLPDPWEQKNHWHANFPKAQPLHMELGCGKGQFIAQLAHRHPEINYLAMDMIDTVLGLSKRNIQAVYQDRLVDNLRLTAWDISRLQDVMGPEDTVERLYINFCNPWPRRKHHKKRLTHPTQLERYKTILTPDAQIHFKTDDDDLFNASLTYFSDAGFKTHTLIPDLTQENYPDNIPTEHETMFRAQGIPIKFIIVSR